MRCLAGFTADFQRDQFEPVVFSLQPRFGNQGLDVLIKDFMFLVRQFLEP